MVNGRTVAEDMAARHEERNGEPPQWPRWIPVSERLPGEYQHVIGWQPTWAVTAEVWRNASGEWLGGDHQFALKAGRITHWMPLPPPPPPPETPS